MGCKLWGPKEKRQHQAKSCWGWRVFCCVIRGPLRRNSGLLLKFLCKTLGFYRLFLPERLYNFMATQCQLRAQEEAGRTAIEDPRCRGSCRTRTAKALTLLEVLLVLLRGPSKNNVSQGVREGVGSWRPNIGGRGLKPKVWDHFGRVANR